MNIRTNSLFSQEMQRNQRQQMHLPKNSKKQPNNAEFYYLSRDNNLQQLNSEQLLLRKRREVHSKPFVLQDQTDVWQDLERRKQRKLLINKLLIRVKIIILAISNDYRIATERVAESKKKRKQIHLYILEILLNSTNQKQYEFNDKIFGILHEHHDLQISLVHNVLDLQLKVFYQIELIFL